MAKKKKSKSKRNDARGYGQRAKPAGPPATASSSASKAATASKKSNGMATTNKKNPSFRNAAMPPMASIDLKRKTHDEIVKLLAALDRNVPAAAAIISADRFESKLQKTMVRLQEVGFRQSQIEDVAVALGYRMDIVAALDWFCLHSPTQDLPPILTEGGVRQGSAQEAGSSSIDVVVPVYVPGTDNDDDDGNATRSSEATKDPVLQPHMVYNSEKKNQRHQDESGSGLNEPTPSGTEETAAGSHNASSKAWILAQYAYVEDDDEDEEQKDAMDGADAQVDVGMENKQPVQDASHDTNDSTQDGETPQQQQTQESSPQDATDAKPSDGTSNAVENGKSIEEQRLELLQSQLREASEDLNNEANGYMRSKLQTKQLKMKVKKLNQQISGIERKVAKTKARQAAANDATEGGTDQADPQDQKATTAGLSDGGDASGNNAHDDDDDDDDGGGGLFGMFEEAEAEAAPTSVQETTTSNIDADVMVENGRFSKVTDYSIPKSWTGTTPQKILEEWLQKRKLPRPKFHRIARTEGQRLTVQKSKRKTDTLSFQMDSFHFSGDARAFLATEALYALDPALPLYRVLPPVFRDLWLSWVSSKQEAKDAEQNERKESEQSKFDSVLALIRRHHGVAATVKGQKQQQSSADSPMQTERDEERGSADKDDAKHKNADSDDDLGDWDDDGHVGDYHRNKQAVGGESKETDERLEWDTGGSPSNATATSPITPLGNKLRQAFVQRQSAKAYKEIKAVRDELPMFGYRDEILRAVRANPVTILCAETGAGKTTQCPQFILEDTLLQGRGDKVNIICTQPRRVAALSVAERVAVEMNDRLGNSVGYQIRMESKKSQNTRLLFCTTGVVLRRLQDDQSLKSVTHVIVDEVHERQQQTDVLLIGLRRMLRTTRPDLKVILMSATLNAALFSSFFNNAPLVSVPGRTFPVASYYLEDLMEQTGHMIDEGSRYALRGLHGKAEQATLHVTVRGGEKRKEVVDIVSDTPEVSEDYPGYAMSTRRSMDRVDEEIINYDLLEDVLEVLLLRLDDNTFLLPPEGADISVGSILVFLPGFGEIRALTDRLQGNRKLGNADRFQIIPLHSTLSSADQKRAFQRSRPGQRKVILATNIAETSVTIPDVVCVIDAGRVREVRQNKRTSTSTLVTDWCSRASAKQRAGRAGRVQPGLCLKMYSSRTAKHVMKAESEPELRRVPLEEVCLSILASKFAANCVSFLQQAPQPPEVQSIQKALNTLIEVGAVVEDEESSNQRLTLLGEHLAKLPVDARLGKMLLFGSLFYCLDPILTIAASLSSKSPFTTFIDDADVAKMRHKAMQSPHSDFLTLCNVYDGFRDACNVSENAGRTYCRSNYLSYSALREIRDSRKQYLDLLCTNGFADRRLFMPADEVGAGGASGNRGRRQFDETQLCQSRFNAYGHQREVIHLVVAAGLFPNVASLVKAPGSAMKDFTMWHRRNERLYFHSSSVNGKLQTARDLWVIFHEKFGTANRVSISTTCFIHPFCLILFGNHVAIDHLHRKVVVDGWMEIKMAAQTGALLRSLRDEIDAILLQGRMGTMQRSDPKHRGKSESDDQVDRLVRGIVQIVSSSD